MNRYLSTVEQTFLAMAERVVMNPVVLVRCRGELEPADVEVAIRRVQRRHPALQQRLVRDDPPWFSDQGVPDAPLRIVERGSDEAWREVVRAELNVPFDQEKGPLLRFVLVRGDHACELICTTDHLNADGRSGLFVLRDVLRALDQPDLRFVRLDGRSCFDEHMPGGLWDLGRLPRATRGLLGEGTRDLAEFARGYASERARLRGEGRETATRPPIDFVHQRLGRRQTEALVEACRAHGTTVQGALMVALPHALAWARGAYDRPRGRPRIGCITPIDIRPALSPPVGDHFGIFAWAPTVVQSLARGVGFWDLARRSHERLQTLSGRGTLAGLRRLLDLQELTLGAGLNQLGPMQRRVLDGAITVSNLGRIQVPRRVAGVEVLTFGFFAMIPDADAVATIQTLDQLEINYCYSQRQIPTATMRELVDAVDEVVDAAIGGPRRGAAEFLEF